MDTITNLDFEVETHTVAVQLKEPYTPGRAYVYKDAFYFVQDGFLTVSTPSRNVSFNVDTVVYVVSFDEDD